MNATDSIGASGLSAVAHSSSEMADILLGPFTDPLSRTWWPGLAFTLVVMLVYMLRERRSVVSRLREVLSHASTHLDIQLLFARQLTRTLSGGAGLSLAYIIATRSVLWADRTVGRPTAPDWSLPLIMVLYTTTLFIVLDASRFLLHTAMHRVPVLWAFHQVHHSL